MTRSLRTGKVLIDWSQNNGSKTTVAPYSLRAREHPTVSTPVTWDEVAACRAPRTCSSPHPTCSPGSASMVLRRILPDRVFGSAGDDVDLLERGDRADLARAPARTSSAAQRRSGRRRPRS